jgi:hypothetical protein
VIGQSHPVRAAGHDEQRFGTIRRGYQRWAASSPVTCGHDCGVLSPEAVFRGADRVPRSADDDLSMPVVAYRPVTPAHRPPGAGAGVRSKRRRPEPTWRELKPQRRALSQAQAQIRRVGPAPSRRRPGNASAAQRPTPPRQLSRRGRSIFPHPSPRRQPARATAAPYRQARHHRARLRHQRCDATRARVRPIQARNNSGEYSLSPEGAKPLLSRADLLLSCYQEALPSTPKYPYLYSNYFHELCGAKRARTSDLLHAIWRQHVHPRVRVQVTVLPRPRKSARVRVSCCTSVLYRCHPRRVPAVNRHPTLQLVEHVS